VRIGLLPGDTNGSGGVNASDIGQTKAVSGQTVSASNFRQDVNISGGSINASDTRFGQSELRHQPSIEWAECFRAWWRSASN
jgi:hypothetical protein